MKKFISVLLVLALFVSMFSGVGVMAADYGTKGNPLVENENSDAIIYSGEDIKFYDDFSVKHSFDSNITGWGGVSYDPTTLEYAQVGEDGVNQNAYGGAGGSLKVTLANPGAEVTPAGYKSPLYVSMLSYNGEWGKLSASNMQNASIAFWISTDLPLYTAVTLYANWSSNSCTSALIAIPAGEHIVEIPLANFVVGTEAFLGDAAEFKITQPRFHFIRQDWSGDGATFYIDSMGLYLNQTNGTTDAVHRDKAIVRYDMESLTADLTNWKTYSGVGALSLSESPDVAVLPEGTEVKWDFDNITELSETGWTVRSGYANATVTLDETAGNIYGDLGKSVKIESTDETRIWRNSATNVSGDAIAVWVKSDRDTTLTVLGLINDWANTGTLTLPVKQGENILLFNYADFECTTAVESFTKINQLQFIISGAGTMWIDSVGYYTEPSEKSESNPNAYGGDGKSVHYSNTALSSDITANRFAYSASKITLSDKNGVVWGKDVTLAVWVKSSRAIKIKIAGDDSYQWESGQNRWISSEYFVPAGESILRIPLSDFTTKQFEELEHDEPQVWEFMGSINFYVANASATEGNLDLYIDQIAVECPVIGDINDDESINILDLIRLKKVMAAVSGATALDVVCDINVDGDIGSDDIGMLRRYLLGSDTLPIAPYKASE